MTKRKYTLIGWAVWNLAKAIAKWKLSRNKKAKAGAAAAVALVLVGGVLAAKSASDDDE
jgi:hypothetical protein